MRGSPWPESHSSWQDSDSSPLTTSAQEGRCYVGRGRVWYGVNRQNGHCPHPKLPLATRWLSGKESTCQYRRQGNQSLAQEDPTRCRLT